MIDQFKSRKNLLVVAHPDDELLGPGARMHRLIQDFGSSVRVIILGEGIISRSKNRHAGKWEADLRGTPRKYRGRALPHRI